MPRGQSGPAGVPGPVRRRRPGASDPRGDSDPQSLGRQQSKHGEDRAAPPARGTGVRGAGTGHEQVGDRARACRRDRDREAGRSPVAVLQRPTVPPYVHAERTPVLRLDQDHRADSTTTRVTTPQTTPRRHVVGGRLGRRRPAAGGRSGWRSQSATGDDRPDRTSPCAARDEHDRTDGDGGEHGSPGDVAGVVDAGGHPGEADQHGRAEREQTHRWSAQASSTNAIAKAAVAWPLGKDCPGSCGVSTRTPGCVVNGRGS